MNAENRIFLELYKEDKKDIPNMESINPLMLGMSDDKFYIALKKLKDKGVIKGVRFTKDLYGRIVKAYLNGISLTESAEEYYKNFVVHERGEKEFSINQKKRIFISHSSKDKKYVDAIVELMEAIGVPENGIFYSSLFGYGIPQGANMYEYLLKQFREYRPKIYYILSDNFYSSQICMNEMGAAWSLECEFLPIFLPGFDLNHMTGPVSSNIIGLKLDDEINEVRGRLGEMKDDLISYFNLPRISEAKWERKRELFIRNINNI